VPRLARPVRGPVASRPPGSWCSSDRRRRGSSLLVRRRRTLGAYRNASTVHGGAQFVFGRVSLGELHMEWRKQWRKEWLSESIQSEAPISTGKPLFRGQQLHATSNPIDSSHFKTVKMLGVSGINAGQDRPGSRTSLIANTLYMQVRGMAGAGTRFFLIAPWAPEPVAGLAVHAMHRLIFKKNCTLNCQINHE